MNANYAYNESYLYEYGNMLMNEMVIVQNRKYFIKSNYLLLNKQHTLAKFLERLSISYSLRGILKSWGLDEQLVRAPEDDDYGFIAFPVPSPKWRRSRRVIASDEAKGR